MDSLNTLVELTTCRPLSREESHKMTEAIIKVRELMVFAIQEKEKQNKKAQDEMMTPPWYR